MDQLKNIVFEPGSPSFVDDPYPYYRELRDNMPVFRDKATGIWLITRYSDVERVTTDFETFSSSKGNVIVDSPVRIGKTLGSLDPPRHDELRRVIQRTLAPSRIAEMLPAIREATRNQLKMLSDREEFDFVADFSRPLLFGAVGALLGLDDAAASRSAELMSGLFRGIDGPMGPVLPPGRFEKIGAFLAEQLQGRVASPTDDLFSVLLEARDNGAPLSDAEIVGNLSTVLLAGNASIGHFLPNVVHALWLNPGTRRTVLDDLALIPAMIEEAVRWDTSTQCFARQVARETVVSDVPIAAGSRVAAFYASANRDERAIDDPDTFDISRRRVRHFGFGAGPHHCAGAHVSRTIIRTILEEALPAFGEYMLDVGRARRAGHVMVRGFVSLPMTIGKRNA